MERIDRPEKYTREELLSFIDGIRGASAKMKSVYSELEERAREEDRGIEPPCYIINLHGSLPLFDILTIIDPNVDTDRAVYFPGSSRIQKSKEVLRRCFENFLWEKQDEVGNQTPLFSLDEVVGGHSVERMINAYNAALRRVAKENLKGTERRKGDIDEVSYDLRNQFPLYVMGIKDSRNLCRNMNRRYLVLSNSSNPDRVVQEFPVKKIITMDDPDFETIRFQHPVSSGWTPENGYYPRIAEVCEKRPYMDLLHDVARFVGADPEMVDPSRARVSTHCDRYSQKPGYD
jgi:hypothetical protein